MALRTLVAVVSLLVVAPLFAQDQLTIAAASDLQSVMPEIAARFEKETGSKVILSFGSSGNFFAQIQNGAPFDIFLSANLQYPQRLIELGFAESRTPQVYAIGRIVLWVQNSSNLDLGRGLSAVEDPVVKKLAIANPAHAPYGAAAEAALRKAGLWEQVLSKLVLGESITQTAEFVESGNADVGILALSLAMLPPLKNEGRYVEVPSELYPQLLQAGIVVKGSHHQKTAFAFLNFLASPYCQSLFKRYGFLNLVRHLELEQR